MWVTYVGRLSLLYTTDDSTETSGSTVNLGHSGEESPQSRFLVLSWA